MTDKNTGSSNDDFDSSFESGFPSSGKKPIESQDASNALKQLNENDKNIITQFIENEKNKRNLKPKILYLVCFFIFVQLVIMNLILFVVIISLVLGDGTWYFIRTIDLTIVPEVFDFLKYYITATVVELLGMLYFMIKKVFDNSIIEFFKLNRKNKENKDSDKG